jgi:hypothetical protein
MLKHVVFMKFKPEVSGADILDLEKGLGALPAAIPEIKGYEFGRDILHTERSFDFALVSAFEDLESMKRYQKHPDHVLVLNKVLTLCDKLLAVDFEW